MRGILNKLGFSIVIIIVIALLGMALFFVIHAVSKQHDEKLWNDGHCDACGGAWRYEQAVGHNHSTSYIYVCEDCGKRIELGTTLDVYIPAQ